MSYILSSCLKREHESNHKRKYGIYFVIYILQVLLVGTFSLLILTVIYKVGITPISKMEKLKLRVVKMLV